jgi:protein gp37
MGEVTSISWADTTFNPWIGCTHVSDACENCYAERDFDNRHHRAKWGAGNPRSRTSVGYWQNPFKWNERAQRTGYRPRIFCASLADIFDNEVDSAWRADLWQVIRDTPLLHWMLLTKRIGNAQKMLPPDWQRRLRSCRSDGNVGKSAGMGPRLPEINACPSSMARRLG